MEIKTCLSCLKEKPYKYGLCRDCYDAMAEDAADKRKDDRRMRNDEEDDPSAGYYDGAGQPHGAEEAMLNIYGGD